MRARVADLSGRGDREDAFRRDLPKSTLERARRITLQERHRRRRPEPLNSVRAIHEHVFVQLTPRQQGDKGELSAMEWLVSQGAYVGIPFGHSPDWDLVADFGGRLIRVQVKTSGCRDRDRWAIQLATRGGNQSWNGTSKLLESARCDYLFVLVADGRRWFIPSSALEARCGLRLGGPKYSEYEVERGRPFEQDRCRRTPLQSLS